MKKVKLKNRPRTFLKIDDKAFEYLSEDKYLKSIRMLGNLREHSAGYAVYQRCITTKKGPLYETIYPHKVIAEKFIKKPESKKRLLVRFKNGDQLDARIENLEWITMAMLRRQHSSSAKSGYRGVILEKGRYRAIIYKDGKSISLGSYKTAKEAAKAYNKKSIELFGKTDGLNKV